MAPLAMNSMNDTPINTAPGLAHPGPTEIAITGRNPAAEELRVEVAMKSAAPKKNDTATAAKTAGNDRPKPKGTSPHARQRDDDDAAATAAAHLATIERLQSQLSAASSQARAAQTEARSARTEAAALKSSLANTERLLTSVTSERDDALRRAEAIRDRHSSAQEHLNRELDVLRKEAEAMEAKNSALLDHVRALKGELYRVGLENQTARNDARTVLKAFDELRERCGERTASGRQVKRGSKSSKIASALGLGAGKKSVAESGIAASKMHGSAGSIVYIHGPEMHQPQVQNHRYQQQQQRMHASYDSIAYAPRPLSPPPQLPCRRRADSLPEMAVPAPPPAHATMGDVRQRASMVYIGTKQQQQQHAPAPAAAEYSTPAAARIAAARRGMRSKQSGPYHPPPSVNSNGKVSQAQHTKRAPAYISNVSEGDVAKCFTPTVA